MGNGNKGNGMNNITASQNLPRPRTKYTNRRVAAIEETVIELFESGIGKTEISRRCNVAPITVRKILTHALTTSRLKRARSRLALSLDTAVESVVTKLPTDSELSFKLLDRMGVFPSESTGPTIDQKINVAVGLLNPPTQAAAKAPPAHEGEPSQRQNLPILENKSSVSNDLAEGATRTNEGASQVIEGEVVSDSIEGGESLGDA